MSLAELWDPRPRPECVNGAGFVQGAPNQRARTLDTSMWLQSLIPSYWQVERWWEQPWTWEVWSLILVLQTRTVSRRCFLFFSLYFLICRTCIKTFWLFLPLKVVEDQNHPIFAKWGSIHKPKSAWSITSFIYLGNRNQFRHQNLYCFSVSCVACFPKRRYVICWDAVYILRGR